MQVGYEQVLTEKDVVKMLFKHQDSVKAAREFVDWLKSKDGVCSHSEMNQFSRRLASGELNSRLSRTNFYKTILHRFLDLGLIEERLRYDHQKQRAVKVYGAVYQPINKRRPASPSLPHIAHMISEKWNNEFFR